jgi:acetylornithine deacetylase
MSNQAVMPFTTLKLGPGDSARSHTADEYILLSEIEQAMEIYYDLLNGLKIKS